MQNLSPEISKLCKLINLLLWGWLSLATHGLSKLITSSLLHHHPIPHTSSLHHHHVVVSCHHIVIHLSHLSLLLLLLHHPIATHVVHVTTHVAHAALSSHHSHVHVSTHVAHALLTTHHVVPLHHLHVIHHGHLLLLLRVHVVHHGHVVVIHTAAHLLTHHSHVVTACHTPTHTILHAAIHCKHVLLHWLCRRSVEHGHDVGRGHFLLLWWLHRCLLLLLRLPWLLHLTVGCRSSPTIGVVAHRHVGKKIQGWFATGGRICHPSSRCYVRGLYCRRSLSRIEVSKIKQIHRRRRSGHGGRNLHWLGAARAPPASSRAAIASRPFLHSLPGRI
mmetsp:Transcript_16640/g.28614  ORF Transcript_16640/g.28614 Transcript_16640/m.28614 type:complete len:332 (+) Transcript_16640:150-1145(+)